MSFQDFFNSLQRILLNKNTLTVHQKKIWNSKATIIEFISESFYFSIFKVTVSLKILHKNFSIMKSLKAQEQYLIGSGR
jgi:hypothetical protein